MTFDPTEKRTSWHVSDAWVVTSFDAERSRLLHRDYIGTTQGLLDTKPTSQTVRMPVKVIKGRRSGHGTSLCRLSMSTLTGILAVCDVGLVSRSPCVVPI